MALLTIEHDTLRCDYIGQRVAHVDMYGLRSLLVATCSPDLNLRLTAMRSITSKFKVKQLLARLAKRYALGRRSDNRHRTFGLYRHIYTLYAFLHCKDVDR